jgi:hypothetical protein
LWQANVSNGVSFQLLKTQWDPQFKSYVKLDGAVLGLTVGGKIINTTTQSSLPGFDNYTVDQMVRVPLYDSFEVQ